MKLEDAFYMACPVSDTYRTQTLVQHGEVSNSKKHYF